MSRFDLPPNEPSTSSRWRSPEFHDELADWSASVLGEEVRLENVRVRAWSTVWRVHAGSGVYYAKQNCELQSFEAALVSALVDVVPTQVVPPTAVDLDRGFLLTPDQGEVLHDHAGDDIDAWCRVVTQWAALQRAVAEQPSALDGVGLSVMLPQDAEEMVAVRTAQLAGLPADDPRALSVEHAARLAAHLPVIRRQAEEVASYELPLTLNHNDLHAQNVFLPRSGDALRFFDLGDAVLQEPLGALLIPLHVLADATSAGSDDPRLRRVADAFLEVWSDLVPIEELRRRLPVCLQLSRLARHESWLRVTPPMTETELADWGSAAAEWLVALVEDPPLK